MAVKKYKYNAKTQLTKNTNVSELKCKGSKHIHQTLVDMVLVNNTQDFIDELDFNKIKYNSFYRCKTHDKKVGGSGYGQHTKGKAEDVVFYKNNKKVRSDEICCLAQIYGFKGIAYIGTYATHIDNRSVGKYKGDERKGFSNNVGGDFFKYFKIDKAELCLKYIILPDRGYFENGDKGFQVKILQTYLNEIVGSKLKVDGKLGKKTIEAVKKLQKKLGIKADGLFGKTTLAKAKAYK